MKNSTTISYLLLPLLFLLTASRPLNDLGNEPFGMSMGSGGLRMSMPGMSMSMGSSDFPMQKPTVVYSNPQVGQPDSSDSSDSSDSDKSDSFTMSLPGMTMTMNGDDNAYSFQSDPEPVQRPLIHRQRMRGSGFQQSSMSSGSGSSFVIQQSSSSNGKETQSTSVIYDGNKLIVNGKEVDLPEADSFVITTEGNEATVVSTNSKESTITEPPKTESKVKHETKKPKTKTVSDKKAKKEAAKKNKKAMSAAKKKAKEEPKVEYFGTSGVDDPRLIRSLEQTNLKN